ncbi:MAG: hypothetical protein ACRDUW_02120 [Pseudonocardiaceae bacterium]
MSGPGRSRTGALAQGFAALRIFIGLVWLSNALAKVTDVGVVDWGFFSFNLITRIATDVHQAAWPSAPTS